MDSGLSVIIPAYNVEDWLAETIESCLDQTYSDLEVIVINDGSTDGTGEVMDRYAKLDSRVRSIHQDNAGAGITRARGQELARKKYMHFLDADDVLSRKAFKTLVDKAEADKVDMVCGNAIVFSDKTLNTRNYFPHPEASNILFRDAQRYWKSKVMWRWIFNTEFVQKNAFPHFPYRMGQDVLYMYMALTKVASFSQVAEQFYYFRQEHKSTPTTVEIYTDDIMPHYVEARNILINAGQPGPLVKYINENYFRDILQVMPRIGRQPSPDRDKIIRHGLALFDNLAEEPFTEDTFGLGINPKGLPLFLAMLRKDDAAIQSELDRWGAPSIAKEIDKRSTFHTIRRRIKSALRPMSLTVRARLGTLKKRATSNKG
jgi:glycosyltransferase involved in cell wall biosynthesis